MAKTSIEWADMVWNPVTGCTKVSQGCKNCYAEVIANRFWGERKFGDVQCHPERLDQPLRWRNPRRVFVNSMSDLFHEDVPDEFITSVFMTMSSSKADQHKFMILTKRPARMMEYMAGWQVENGWAWAPGETGKRAISAHIWPLKNIWLGVSVENQAAADERIPLLLQTPAAVRFVSCEPLLGPVDLPYFYSYYSQNGPGVNGPMTTTIGLSQEECLDWVICGGESGPKARPMNIEWARSLKDQCVSAGVPFFFKQAVIDGEMVKMPELDGREWNEYPK